MFIYLIQFHFISLIVYHKWDQ